MNETLLAQKLYCLQNVIFQSVDVNSDLYQFLQQDKNQHLLAKVETFSDALRAVLGTQLATYFDALLQLKEGNIQPLVAFFTKNPSVTKIVNKHYPILEALYYASESDIVLIEDQVEACFNNDKKDKAIKLSPAILNGFLYDQTLSRKNQFGANKEFTETVKKFLHSL